MKFFLMWSSVFLTSLSGFIWADNGTPFTFACFVFCVGVCVGTLLEGSR